MSLHAQNQIRNRLLYLQSKYAQQWIHIRNFYLKLLAMSSTILWINFLYVRILYSCLSVLFLQISHNVVLCFLMSLQLLVTPWAIPPAPVFLSSLNVYMKAGINMHFRWRIQCGNYHQLPFLLLMASLLRTLPTKCSPPPDTTSPKIQVLVLSYVIFEEKQSPTTWTLTRNSSLFKAPMPSMGPAKGTTH